MERLATSLRLPSSVQELDESSPAFAGAPTSLDASQLAAWLQQARQHPVTGLEWGVVLAAVKHGSTQLWQQAGTQLVSLLAWAAQRARLLLEPGGAAGQQAAVAAAAAEQEAAAALSEVDAGNPRQLLALRNTLKLSLFFLCCIARGEGGSAAAAPAQQGDAGAAVATGKGPQQPRAKKSRRGGGGGDGAAAEAAACAAARLISSALLAVSAIEEAIWASRVLLPALGDLRAAARLAQATALHCLAHPLHTVGSSSSFKALAESCQQAMSGGRASMNSLTCRQGSPFRTAAAAGPRAVGASSPPSARSHPVPALCGSRRAARARRRRPGARRRAGACQRAQAEGPGAALRARGCLPCVGCWPGDGIPADSAWQHRNLPHRVAGAVCCGAPRRRRHGTEQPGRGDHRRPAGRGHPAGSGGEHRRRQLACSRIGGGGSSSRAAPGCMPGICSHAGWPLRQPPAAGGAAAVPAAVAAAGEPPAQQHPPPRARPLLRLAAARRAAAAAQLCGAGL